MSVPIAYPASLPTPQTSGVASSERRFLATPERPRQARAIQRDRSYTEQLSFPPMRAEQYAVWREWWRNDLLEGGAWFSAEWPLPQGYGTAVRKFLAAPDWAFIPGGMWRISAVCEVRGAGQLPMKPDYSQIIGLSNPLVYWRLNGDGVDSGTLGLPLIVSPLLTSFGGAPLNGVSESLDFDPGGENAAVAVANSALNFGSDGFTVTALIQRAAVIGDCAIVAHAETNVDFGNWFVSIDAAGHLVLTLANANSAEARVPFTSSKVIPFGVRTHVAARLEPSGDVSLFQDMELCATGVYLESLWNSLSRSGVGCIPRSAGEDPATHAYKGLVSDVAIWDRALTTPQLQNQFDSLTD